MALLDDIATELTSNSVVGGATGWDVFKSILPENSGTKCLVIYETGGLEVDNTNGTKYEKVTFQIMGRGDEFGYSALRTKMQAAFDAINDATIASYVYLHATTGGPIPIGYDKNNRPLMTWNFEAMVERSAL